MRRRNSMFTYLASSMIHGGLTKQPVLYDDRGMNVPAMLTGDTVLGKGRDNVLLPLFRSASSLLCVFWMSVRPRARSETVVFRPTQNMQPSILPRVQPRNTRWLSNGLVGPACARLVAVACCRRKGAREETTWRRRKPGLRTNITHLVHCTNLSVASRAQNWQPKRPTCWARKGRRGFRRRFWRRFWRSFWRRCR